MTGSVEEHREVLEALAENGRTELAEDADMLLAQADSGD